MREQRLKYITPKMGYVSDEISEVTELLTVVEHKHRYHCPKCDSRWHIWSEAEHPPPAECSRCRAVMIKIQPLHPDMGGRIPLPKKMSEHAAGFDLAAAIDSTIYLGAGERALVPCGFAMALPPGYEGQIRPRSGLALKHGVTVLNAPGTIDSDYRGEVKVLLANFGQMPFALGPGTRIAQLVVAPVTVAEFDVVMEIDETDRGQGGFGSTG